MSPDAQALANNSPTFADLCDRVRQAKISHLRAIKAVERAESELKAAKEREASAIVATEEAEDALNAMIERECVIEDAS